MNSELPDDKCLYTMINVNEGSVSVMEVRKFYFFSKSLFTISIQRLVKPGQTELVLIANVKLGDLVTNPCIPARSLSVIQNNKKRMRRTSSLNFWSILEIVVLVIKKWPARC